MNRQAKVKSRAQRPKVEQEGSHIKVELDTGKPKADPSWMGPPNEKSSGLKGASRGGTKELYGISRGGLKGRLGRTNGNEGNLRVGATNCNDGDLGPLLLSSPVSTAGAA